LRVSVGNEHGRNPSGAVTVARSRLARRDRSNETAWAQRNNRLRPKPTIVCGPL
jgi:hypothetical protein